MRTYCNLTEHTLVARVVAVMGFPREQDEFSCCSSPLPFNLYFELKGFFIQ